MHISSTGTDRYGDGDVPEVDVEPYRNGSHIVTPTQPIHESKQEGQNNPACHTFSHLTYSIIISRTR